MDGKRNIQIEGLRGIAILFVIIYHVFDRYQQIYLKQEIKFLNHWGSFGVTVFFMISAYFAVSPVTNECDLKFGVKKWLRKVLRLWPSYFVSIVIIFITTRIVYLPERTVSFSEFLMNMFLINRFWGIPYVDGAHWYLNALISMFLVNGIIQIGKTHKWPWRYLLWMALVIVEEKIFDTGDMYLLGGPYVTVFCMGIALRFLIEIENRETRKNWFIVLILGLITTYGIRGGVAVIENIITLLIIWLCICKKIKLFEIKPLIFIGTVSYTLYLTHQNISFIIQNCIVNAMGKYMPICPIIALVLVFGLGILVYYFVEKPVQQIISRLCNSNFALK